MKCSHCNKEIPEISKFCPYCGIKINNDFDTEKEDQVNKKSINKEKRRFSSKKRFIAVLIGGLVILFVFIGVSAIISNSNPKKSELLMALEETNSNINLIELDDAYEISNLYHDSSYDDNGFTSSMFSFNLSFVEEKETKNNHFVLSYSITDTLNAPNVDYVDMVRIEIEYYKNHIKFVRSQGKDYNDESDLDYNDYDEGETYEIYFNKTKADEIEANGLNYDVFFILSDYIPKFEKEYNIKLSDYSYYTNFKPYMNSIQERMQEQKEIEEQTLKEEQEKLRLEEAEEQEQLEKERLEEERLEEERLRQNEYEQQQQEQAKKGRDIVNSIIICLKLEDVNSYERVYSDYQEIAPELSEEMRNDLDLIFSNFKLYCTDIENREEHLNTIDRLATSFYEKW